MGRHLLGFQSPSGDSLFSDDREKAEWLCQELLGWRFNPLAGIRCFLTSCGWLSKNSREPKRFNPLAGIRCFLTSIGKWISASGAVFQSPSGDSLFSDVYRFGTVPAARPSFNPLAGIRCFLTGPLAPDLVSKW